MNNTNELISDTPKKIGRPTIYNLELANKIAEYIEDGGALTPEKIPNEFPKLGVIWRWAEEHEEFNDILARARARRAETYSEKINEIAEDESRDMIDDPKHGLRANPCAWQRDKLRIGTMQYLMGKHNPKYAEQTNPSNQINVQLNVDASNTTNSDKQAWLDRRVKELEQLQKQNNNK